MDLIEYPDAEMMMMDLANILAGEIEGDLLHNETVSFAVPGGTTPGPIFDALCAAKHIEWDRVRIFLTDERWVPESSERSNTRLLKSRLMVEAAAAATLVPLYGGTEKPEDSLAELEEALRPALPISVCLLGMGADMHTASIFPGADQLDHALNGDDILVPMRAPGAPEPRITLSAKVLRDSLSRHIVIIGDEKREALEKALKLSPNEAPIQAVLGGSTVHWARD